MLRVKVFVKIPLVYKKSLLSNGLRVVMVPMESVKSVTALVMVATGSRYETKKINGISHFLEHMTFKGTKKRPSSLAISSLIDSIGGTFNAFTSKDHTGFYVKASAEHLGLVLDVISDMLINSLFDPKELDKERGVIIEEINMYEDEPQALVGEYFEELLYGDSPVGWRIIGTKENINRITRQEMVDYVGKMYHSGSIVVGIAGKVGQQESRIVGQYFGKVRRAPENVFLSTKDDQKKAASLVHFKKTDQAHLCLGVRAYPLGHPDRYVLAVLANILGGNMSSRLFQEVRTKRGLAYYIHSGVEEYQDRGYMVSQAGLRIAAIEEAIKVIAEQYGLMSAKPVSTAELRRAKDYFKGRMVLRLEDSYNVAAMYTTQEVLEKEIETPEEILEKVERVTAEDVQRVAKDIFVNQGLNLAVVGPFKEETRFDKLLQL